MPGCEGSAFVKREDLTAYVDRELSPEEEQALSREIADDPRMLREVSLLLRQRLMLAEVMSSEQISAARTGRARRVFRVAVPLAAAAAVLLGIGANLWWKGTGGPAAATVLQAERAERARIIDGAKTRRALAEGARLAPGDSVEVARSGTLRFRYAGEESYVQAGEQTILRMEASPEGAKRLYVTSGTLKVTVAPQPEESRMVVTTPHAALTLVGTELSLDVTGNRTQVDVTDGTVDVTGPDGSKKTRAHAGQHVTATARCIGPPFWRAGATVGQVRVLRCFSVPVPRPTSVVFDGTALWLSSAGNRKLYRVDAVSGNLLRTIELDKSAGRADCLAWDGKLLWGAYRERAGEKHGVCAIDPATGDIVESIDTARGITGLAFGDGKLWGAFHRGKYMHIATIRPPQDPERPLLKVGYPESFVFAHQDGSLWMKRVGKLLVRVDPGSGKNLGAFVVLPFGGSYMAAGGGGTFWLLHRHGYHVTLIERPQTLLRVRLEQRR